MDVVELDLSHAIQLAVLEQQFLFEVDQPTEKNLVQLEIQNRTRLSHDYVAIGCFDAGLLVAYCLFTLPASESGIEQLFVMQDYRGQGYAKAMLNWLNAQTQVVITHSAFVGVDK